MGKSRSKTNFYDSFSLKDITEIIKMAWNDRTSMQDIEKKYALKANEVEKFLRHHLSDKDFIRWKKRLAKRFTLKSKKAKVLGALN